MGNTLQNKAKLFNVFDQGTEDAAIAALNYAHVESPTTLGEFINHKDPTTKSTPLIVSTKRGHRRVVERLLELGARPEGLPENYSLIHIAAEYGHVDLLEYFYAISDPAIFVSIGGIDKMSPIYAAAINNKAPAVRFFLHVVRADPNAVGSILSGATPLFIAAQKGYLDVVYALVFGGANYNLPWRSGATPLLIASQNGHSGIVEYLLKQSGIDINHHRMDGSSALMLAASQGHDAVVRLLIEHGADLDLQNRNGQTAVLLAAANNHDGSVRLLLDNGADVNLADKDGITPAGAALANNHSRIYQLLQGF